MQHKNRTDRTRPAARRGLATLWGTLSAAVIAVAFATPFALRHDRLPDRDPIFLQPQPASSVPPGWLATYRSGAAKPLEVFAHTPSASFAASTGESVHPLIAPEGLVARYNGAVAIPTPGRYRFGADFEGGAAEVSVTGKDQSQSTSAVLRRATGSAGPVMSDWLRLPAGEVQVRFQFRRDAGKAARFRAMWEREGVGVEGFLVEPIPASAVTPGKTFEASAAKGLAAQRGRVLLSEMGCANCHLPGAAEEALLTLTPPDLKGIAQRVSPSYLRAWIADPQAHKPGCGMPDLFPQDAKDADAITHFLVSLAPAMPPPAPAATEPAGIERGRELFHRVGCVACHSSADSPSAQAPVPYGNLKNKWRPEALSSFLRDPVAVRHSGRMPSLVLSEDEADSIATYLVNAWGGAAVAEAFTVDAAKARTGREAFVAVGCVNCHVLDRELSAGTRGRRANPLNKLRPGRGCLNAKDTATPRYTMSDDERADLAAAIEQIKSAGDAAAVPAPADHAATRIEALGCVNCHDWHGRGGVHASFTPYFHAAEEVDLGDEGRLPPRLGGVGGKLTSAWLREVLGEAGRARPYMHARMPQFGAEHAKALTDGLAKFDGLWPDRDVPEPQADGQMAAAGRTLTGAAALNCISCHTFGDRASAGTPGPDITAFAGRLRYDWWRRYIRAPDRFKPGTRMPTFYPGATGAVTSVLGGDPAKQADAMWAYFNMGGFMPEPDGLPGGNPMLVQVRDRPVVLRTFLKSAGSRGIAVGFPSGMHFAYDAGECRLVEAWKGAFLDASGAWANRGGTEAGGQGPRVWQGSAKPTVMVAAAGAMEPGDGSAPAFNGYSLDEGGVPTFYSHLTQPGDSGVEVIIEERFAPAGDGKFRRHFNVRGVMEGVEVWINGHGATIDAATLVNAETPRPRTDPWLVTRPTKPGVPMQFEMEVTP